MFFSFNEKHSEAGISNQVISEDLLNTMLLSSLPRYYDYFVIAVESRDQLPSTSSLKTKLIEESHRREDTNEPSTSTSGEELCYSRAKSENK